MEILDNPHELRMNFVLGFLLGSLNSHIESYCPTILIRLPSDVEINSMYSILKRRMSEIKYSSVEINVSELERLEPFSEYYRHESKNSRTEKDEIHNEASDPEISLTQIAELNESEEDQEYVRFSYKSSKEAKTSNIFGIPVTK